MKTETIQHLNFSPVQRMKSAAFTLAETLIVIGIIGVVAALTLPNLNHATGDKEKVTKVKKVYSSLSEALDRAQAVYGPVSEWPKNQQGKINSNTLGERVVEFLKISKNCKLEQNKGCMSSQVSKLPSGSTHYYLDSSVGGVDGDYRVILGDGTSVVIASYDPAYMVMYVDIDGPSKGKNTWGDDIFAFKTDASLSLIPYGSDTITTFENLVKDTKNSGWSGATWILRYDNIDYLKFVDQNGTCSNGNVVTEENPSCN